MLISFFLGNQQGNFYRKLFFHMTILRYQVHELAFSVSQVVMNLDHKTSRWTWWSLSPSHLEVLDLLTNSQPIPNEWIILAKTCSCNSVRQTWSNQCHSESITYQEVFIRLQLAYTTYQKPQASLYPHVIILITIAGGTVTLSSHCRLPALQSYSWHVFFTWWLHTVSQNKPKLLLTGYFCFSDGKSNQYSFLLSCQLFAMLLLHHFL